MNLVFEIARVVDRCLAITARCVENGNDRQANELMKSRLSEIAREVSHWQLSGEIKARYILRPLEEQLVDRFGSVLGQRLCWDFLDAFWLQSWIDIPLDHAQLDRHLEPTSEWHGWVVANHLSRREFADRDDYSGLISKN